MSNVFFAVSIGFEEIGKVFDLLLILAPIGFLVYRIYTITKFFKEQKQFYIQRYRAGDEEYKKDNVERNVFKFYKKMFWEAAYVRNKNGTAKITGAEFLAFTLMRFIPMAVFAWAVDSFLGGGYMGDYIYMLQEAGISLFAVEFIAVNLLCFLFTWKSFFTVWYTVFFPIHAIIIKGKYKGEKNNAKGW